MAKNLATTETVERLADAVDNLFALVVRRQGDAVWHGVALSQPQRLALRLIIAGEPLRLHELAHRMMSTTSKASRTVSALRELELVQAVEDPLDRRAMLISSTAVGRQVAEARHRRLVEAVAEAFADVPEEDQERLAELLEQLEPVISTVSPIPPPASAK